MSGPTPQHELLIFSDSLSLPEDYSSLHQNGGRGIRYHRASSQEAQDAIQAFGGLRQLQPAVTTLASYDYKAKSVVGAELGSHQKFAGKTLTAQADRLETYDYVGPYAFASRDEAEHYALIQREAHEARNKTRLGQGSVRTFRPGAHFKLTESPLDAQGKDVEKRFLLTALDHAGYNNLPRDVMERAARLMDEADSELLEAAKEHGYANRFDAIRADVPWRPMLADGTGARLNPRPTAQGVQSAIVVGPNGETSPSGADELYTDKLGRIKVRFHWQRAETDQDRATCWLRLASRNAGPGYGAQWIPRIGQEVLIGFLEADIDRPIVLGALYNGQGEAGTSPTPGGDSTRQSDPSLYKQASDHSPSAQANLAGGNSPAWHAAAPGDDAHRNAGALMGFKTKEFGGSGYNQLVFDDTDDQQRTQLATTQAFTQLNLGHLIHQADNYRGSFRGSGYELRTDAYGSIRAAQGLMLDAHRKRVLGEHADLTLTGLYNVLEKLRAGVALSAKEKAIHDKGLVAVLRSLHDELDAAVLDAYGWRDLLPSPASGRGAGGEGDAILLERLVALNAERAAEEAAGHIRWLRPEFQNPGAIVAQPAPKTTALFDEPPAAATPAAAPAAKLGWPSALPEQVAAVARVLAGSPAPLSLDDIAIRFSGRSAWKKRLPEILETLTALGRARSVAGSRWMG